MPVVRQAIDGFAVSCCAPGCLPAATFGSRTGGAGPSATPTVRPICCNRDPRTAATAARVTSRCGTGDVARHKWSLRPRRDRRASQSQHTGETPPAPSPSLQKVDQILKQVVLSVRVAHEAPTVADPSPPTVPTPPRHLSRLQPCSHQMLTGAKTLAACPTGGTVVCDGSGDDARAVRMVRRSAVSPTMALLRRLPMDRTRRPARRAGARPASAGCAAAYAAAPAVHDKTVTAGFPLGEPILIFRSVPLRLDMRLACTIENVFDRQLGGIRSINAGIWQRTSHFIGFSRLATYGSKSPASTGCRCCISSGPSALATIGWRFVTAPAERSDASRRPVVTSAAGWSAASSGSDIPSLCKSKAKCYLRQR